MEAIRIIQAEQLALGAVLRGLLHVASDPSALLIAEAALLDRPPTCASHSGVPLTENQSDALDLVMNHELGRE